MSPGGMSLTKLSLAGNSYIFPGQGEFGQWHPACGRENLETFFYSVLSFSVYAFLGHSFFNIFDDFDFFFELFYEYLSISCI